MKTLKYLVIILLFTVLPVNVMCVTSAEENKSVIYFEDGSYTITTIVSPETRASTNRVGTKKYEHYNASDEIQWIATITGYFTYDGTSCTCTYSSLNVDIINTQWSIVSGISQESGNTATAELVMSRKILGLIPTEKTLNMYISCDKNGNLS